MSINNISDLYIGQAFKHGDFNNGYPYYIKIADIDLDKNIVYIIFLNDIDNSTYCSDRAFYSVLKFIENKKWIPLDLDINAEDYKDNLNFLNKIIDYNEEKRGNIKPHKLEN